MTLRKCPCCGQRNPAFAGHKDGCLYLKPAKPLDLSHPDANMFGCFPCPVCKSIYRWPTQQGTIRCDDCGLVQKLDNHDTQ